MTEQEVDLWTTQLKDGGPQYTETNFGRTIVEPWNAVTALAFVALVVVWLIRLRG